MHTMLVLGGNRTPDQRDNLPARVDNGLEHRVARWLVKHGCRELAVYCWLWLRVFMSMMPNLLISVPFCMFVVSSASLLAGVLYAVLIAAFLGPLFPVASSILATLVAIVLPVWGLVTGYRKAFAIVSEGAAPDLNTWLSEFSPDKQAEMLRIVNMAHGQDKSACQPSR